MLNHIHLVIYSEDVIGFLRDFKKFTSKELQKNIIATEPNILKLFKKSNSYEFWQPNNMPKIIESDEFLEQKIDYIHNNPIKKQYVKNAEDWVWSSANSESRIQIDEMPI